MSIELLLLIGGLALLDTLSPTTIGVTVYLLLTEKEKLTKYILIYLLTVALLYFLIGVSLMLGLSFLLETISKIFQNRVVSWFIFIIGGILFIASFFVQNKKKKSKLPVLNSRSILSILTLGFITFLIEAGTAFPYFASIGLMINSKLTWFEWSSILAAYNFIMILPSLLLFTCYLLFRKWITKPLQKLHMKTSNYGGSALSWIMCIVGFILMFKSLDYL
ncbi:GAP family protein [Heyndrickxia sp. NPDC080065]|uniref:GAP family protein n=1 Tax=Heyndrickxia sp. NPDC080065 TaxID=3390568 RepID=UPI003CFCC7F9